MSLGIVLPVQRSILVEIKLSGAMLCISKSTQARNLKLEQLTVKGHVILKCEFRDCTSGSKVNSG